MDSSSVHTKRAFWPAFGVFLFLVGFLVLVALNYDLSHENLQGFLFLTVFICCALIAVNLFDTIRSASLSDELKKSLAISSSFSSEELYVQLYKNSPVPYFILDSEGHVKSANTAAVRMIGLAQGKIRGINIFSRVQYSSLEHLDLLVEKYRSGLPASDEVVKVKRPDHREVWALLSLFTYTDLTGQRIGLLTLVDITKQKKAEEAKSEFVSLASHQLRTPIAGMKWSAELLLVDNPETLTDRQRKYIDRLLISIKRMAILVDDFLRVSRFELGTFQAEYRKVSLSVLFKDIMSEQSLRAQQKNLVIKTFFDESVDEIITDPNLIRMIVTNLYSNATKYTKEKGTIHLGFGKKGDNVVISVADNGMGIPIEDQDEIFSKLFRASNAVRDVPDGTGLGLYIVREAVLVLKGNISFTTTENVGTTFEVVLPLELSESITD
ncbi:MAG: hypothetical protein RLZZ230_716 [Candidatus Parcubacteria bacterium]|jgi:PAS domain S-box-containing protein